MKLEFHILDVFSERPFGGNPLAVVLGGEALDAGTMQRIAGEFNLSETVFVLPPATAAATRRVRIFTPRVELPFAGHPSVGTAFLLAALGQCDLAAAKPVVVLEEGIGNVAVRIIHDRGEIRAAQMSVPQMPAPVGQPLPDADDLARMLSLESADLHPDIAAQAWSCGVPFLFVAVSGPAAVSRAELRLDLWQRLLRGLPASSPYIFAIDPGADAAQVRARMFAPEFGVAEDPATGAAAAALAGLLRQAFPGGRDSWAIEQGVEMGRPSRIALSYQSAPAGLLAVQVGGAAVRVASGWLDC